MRAIIVSFFKRPIPVLCVDLHSHSSISDGLLSPSDLVRRAAANGVSMLALSDHDSLGGLSEARATADTYPMRFINGVEISIEWGGLPVHILGLNFDAQNPALITGLDQICSGRTHRAERMSAELEKIGIAGSFAGALRHAQNPSLISRAHFARYFVEIGLCKDMRSVFESYLVPGKPGYVEHRWANLSDAVTWIVAAGGVAAIAHPGRYQFSRPQMRRLFDEFKSLGGQALEVVSGSHSNDNVTLFSRYAREYDLFASAGSDFHGPGESYVDLGKIAALPADLKPVWTLF